MVLILMDITKIVKEGMEFFYIWYPQVYGHLLKFIRSWFILYRLNDSYIFSRGEGMGSTFCIRTITSGIDGVGVNVRPTIPFIRIMFNHLEIPNASQYDYEYK